MNITNLQKAFEKSKRDLAAAEQDAREAENQSVALKTAARLAKLKLARARKEARQAKKRAKAAAASALDALDRLDEARKRAGKAEKRVAKAKKRLGKRISTSKPRPKATSAKKKISRPSATRLQPAAKPARRRGRGVQRKADLPIPAGPVLKSPVNAATPPLTNTPTTG